VTFVLENISFSVGQENVIDDVSLTLDQGSMSVLLGPTSSGKTTLMRLIAGLDRPTTGRLIEGGVDVSNVAVRRRSIAMVYQQFVNYPSLTVYENIASPLRVASVGRAEIDARSREGTGAAVATRQSLAAFARATVGRSAATHGNCSRPRQARQTGFARRALSQSRL
jgi:ABC-type sugar transport system ATPase subunit